MTMVDPSTDPVKIDIILPAFNAEDTLVRAVESVVHQDQLGRLIIVDDCSTDGTRRVIQTLAATHSKVTPVLLEENVGPAEARNLGLQKSDAAWVTLLDSDDWMEPTRLEKLLRHADNFNADIVADDIYMHRETEPAVCIWSTGAFDPFFIDAPFFAQMNIARYAGSTREFGYIKPLFRAEVLKRFDAPWRPSLRIMEDYDLYLRCLVAGDRFLFTPRAGYHYDRGNASRAFRPQNLRTIVEIDRQIVSASTDPAVRTWVGEHADDFEALLLWVSIFGDRRLSDIPKAIWRSMVRPRIGAILGRRLWRRAQGLSPDQVFPRNIPINSPAHRTL